MKSSFFYKETILFKNWRIFFVLFALLFRFYGAVINEFSNDNHVEVIQKYEELNKTPHLSDCFQCYHPKVFHYTLLKLKNFLKLNNYQLVLAGQIINSLLSILTLFLILQILNNKSSLILFLLILVNSNFAGISIQFTNDMFAIFFSTLFLYLLYKDFYSYKNSSYILLSIVVLCAFNSKGTGLSIFFVYLIYSGWLLFKSFSWNKILLLLVVNSQFMFFSEYSFNLKQFKNPFTTNLPNQTIGSSKTQLRDNLLTVPLIDVFKEPHLGHVTAKVPLQNHAANIWSSLYGRLLSEQFSSYPIKWANYHPSMVWLRRILLLLGIYLVFIFIRGSYCVVSEFKEKKNINFDLFMLMTAIMQLILYLTYTLLKMNSAANKAIYIYPAIFSFLYLMSKGLKDEKFKVILYIILILFTIESSDILLKI